MGLTKRKNSYYVEFPVLDDGKTLRLASRTQGARLKRWKVGCTNRSIAAQHEALIKADLLKGMIPSGRSAQLTTFRLWAEQYLALEDVTRLRSYEKHVRTVRKHLVKFFGDRALHDIGIHDVETYRAQRKRKNGSALALSTINWDHAVLKAMLNKARKRGLLTVNPACDVPLPNPHNERDRLLSEEEWPCLYHAAAPHLKPILRLAYRLGPRDGEIKTLRWPRVDRDRWVIMLHASNTKTQRKREIPMTDDVIADFKELYKVRRIGDDHVFLHNGKPIRSIKTAFHNALRRAGIKDFRFHDLRHCAATNMRRRGVDLKTVMAIMGWTSMQMWGRYNSIEPEDLKMAASKLNTLITPVTQASSVPIAKSAN